MIGFVLALLLVLGTALAADDDCSLPDLETYSQASPPLELTRPDRDWVFIDVAKAKAQAARARSPSEAELEFADLVTRLWNAPLRALVSVEVRKAGSPPPELAAIEKDLRDEVARRPGATLLEGPGRVALPGGIEAVKVDFALAAQPAPGQREAPGGASSVWRYSRVVAVRPKAGVTIALLFECPQSKWSKAQAGWLKLLKKLKLPA